ncbi:hypothetical protein EDD86DRAFT_218956 [Gorgonomyces haynaldii]|nr:hypothetical protein EDD86DRAFT_218922 [Gorgonomyces haynaldii]KAI8908441.1 hypothetical protein EDD86DRAFT_218956 [Gorgonomyces haynaldii]
MFFVYCLPLAQNAIVSGNNQLNGTQVNTIAISQSVHQSAVPPVSVDVPSTPAVSDAAVEKGSQPSVPVQKGSQPTEAVQKGSQPTEAVQKGSQPSDTPKPSIVGHLAVSNDQSATAVAGNTNNGGFQQNQVIQEQKVNETNFVNAVQYLNKTENVQQSSVVNNYISQQSERVVQTIGPSSSASQPVYASAVSAAAVQQSAKDKQTSQQTKILLKMIDLVKDMIEAEQP